MFLFGKELFDYITTLSEYWSKVGNHLNQAVEVYNCSVGTLECRVLPITVETRPLTAAGADCVNRS